MSNVNEIEYSSLETNLKNFCSEYKKFNSTAYSTFSSSYLKNCSDSYVMRMQSKLTKMYSDIDKGYKAISLWWSDYVSNAKKLENYMSGVGSDGGVAGYVLKKSLSKLNEKKQKSIKVAAKSVSTVSAAVKAAGEAQMSEIEAKKKLAKAVRNAEADEVKKLLKKVGAEVIFAPTFFNNFSVPFTTFDA